MKAQRSIQLLSGFLVLLSTANLEAQTTPGPQPNICTRPCWAARAPNCALSTLSGPTRAIVHHTAAASDWNTTSLETSKAKIRSIQNYHMDTQGWCDIGYHFLVDKLGNLFEGRDNSMFGLRRGIHDACNANSFGFTLLGYFHPPYNHSPTPEMLNSYYNVIAWRMPAGWSPYGASTYCGNTVGFVDGHRKVVSTACPGDLVHPNLITENYNGGPMRTSIAARRGGGQSLTTKQSLVWMPDGRMVLFAVGTDTAIWHNWQTTVGGTWSGWVSLGGSGLSDCQGMVESDGRLVVYGIGQGSPLWQRWQTSVGGAWSAWTSLGGVVYQFNVVRQTNGLPVAFAISTGGSVWYSYQPSAGGSWTGWVALGGATSGFSKVQGYLGSDNRIICFGIGNGSQLWQIWQTNPGSPGGSWSAWTGLGSALTDFEVIKGASGLPLAFGVTAGSGDVTHNWQPSPGAGWNGWVSLGGSGFARIDGLKKNSNTMVVFGIGGSGEVWHNWQTTVGGSWSGWFSLGSTVTSLTADVNSNDALLFFGRGTDSAMWHRWQSVSGGTWSAWASLGGSLK